MTPANLQSHVIHPHIQEERRGEERIVNSAEALCPLF
jgi:hypothetical protein